jgi:hypothetical protein
MMRAINKMGSVGAIPQSRELNVNSARQMIKNRFRPKRDTSHPVIGRMIALDTRYDVRTQVLSSLLAPMFPAMCGSATFAMLVSRTSMNAANDTTNAINQGFALGIHVDRDSEWPEVELTGLWVSS